MIEDEVSVISGNPDLMYAKCPSVFPSSSACGPSSELVNSWPCFIEKLKAPEP